MKRILLAALAAAVLPLAAQASDLSYTFVQGGYVYNNNDKLNSHGWSGEGQVAIGPNFYAFGGGSRTNLDQSDDIFHGWNLGGGFHTPISDKTDFVADVEYARQTVSGVSGSSKIYQGDVGVRSAMAQHFEGWAKVGYAHDNSDIGDASISTSKGKGFGLLGGEYKVNKNVGLVGEARFASGNKQVFVGPRISF